MPVAPNFRLQWLDSMDSELYPYKTFIRSDLSSESDGDLEQPQGSLIWMYGVWIMGITALAMGMIIIIYRRKSSNYDDPEDKAFPSLFLNDDNEVKLDFNTKPVQPAFSLKERIAQSVPWKSSVGFRCAIYSNWKLC